MVATRPFYSLDDYVKVEEDSHIRHEFVRGEIFAMAGGTVEHGRIAANVVSALRAALRGTGCIAVGSDVRVGHETNDFRAYPDATVICGAPTYVPRPSHTVSNPRIVVEVLSEGTAAYDRGEKLLQYQSIPSIAAIVLVSQESRIVTVVRRTSEGFQSAQYGATERFTLPDVAGELTVAELYD
ncbi:Uma2 family endonuclease [Myxococcota bacterium]|nr:Uma2 family endonuclease [Myxococcota bacterium]